MGSLSNRIGTEFAKAITGKAPETFTNNIWVMPVITAPTDEGAGTGGTPASATDFANSGTTGLALVSGSWTAPSAGITTYGATIDFGVSTGGATIVGIVFYDAAGTYSTFGDTAKYLGYTGLASDVIVDAGQGLVINISTVQVDCTYHV